ncbi:RNA-dependent RNA polymerase, putative [Entamoeba invadens IP1]|uniref:RNA-dependent RNA polymerase n=1 Tax=Entamoeba invadens IP1 TaxID=370355 RepID=A0A0A1UEG4_ENTIV|nr:RNA-dependent RNA polymerase, putative [Entamoeba invadens IP1]ELP91216.1 RNA-dependent RNA polymerase, putative [Entamoeba invadens IP1]|eukprot:XP_004257987.1 RNA-dependent RNA polymerase, putative [Entamoeba invadens IP1]
MSNDTQSPVVNRHTKFKKDNSKVKVIRYCEMCADVGFGSFVTPSSYASEKFFPNSYVNILKSEVQVSTMEYMYIVPHHTIHHVFVSNTDTKTVDSEFIMKKVIQVLQNNHNSRMYNDRFIINIPLQYIENYNFTPKVYFSYPTIQETIALFQLEGLYLEGYIMSSQIDAEIVSYLKTLKKDMLIFFKRQTQLMALENDYLRIFSLRQAIQTCKEKFHDSIGKSREDDVVLRMEVNSSVVRMSFGYNESNAILEDFSEEFRVKMLRLKFLNNENKMHVLERVDTDLLAFYLVKGYSSYFQNRRYEFFLSNPSQSRSGACWFIDNTDDITRVAAYNSLGIDLKSAKIKNSGILLMRAGLFGSDSVATAGIYPQQIKRIEDVTNEGGYTFSDGVGRISLSLASKVFAEYRRCGENVIRVEEPAAFQIRFAGVKGVVSVDCLDKSENIYFRPSQIKIEAFPERVQKLRVVQIPQYRSGRMNEQLALGLEYLEIPIPNFIQCAKEYLRKYFTSIPNDEVVRLFQKNAKNPTVAIALKMVMAAGRDSKIFEEPFVKANSLVLRMAMLSEKSDFIKFDIDNSAFLMGVMDETGILEEGQVFIQLSSNSVFVPSSRLLAVKFPATHPGDFLLLRNVCENVLFERKRGYERLAYLKDVIVFSSKGYRPDPNKMAGGDLDGDEYLVIWNPLFLPKLGKKSHPPANYDFEETHLERFLEYNDMKHAFVSQLYSKYVLAQISTCHKKACMSLGMQDEISKALSQLISVAVDAPKTGAEIDSGEINELVERVREQKIVGQSVLIALKDFFNQQVPLVLDRFHAELMDIVNTLHYDTIFLSDNIIPELIPFVRRTRNEFNKQIELYINKQIPYRIQRDTERTQLVVGGVFRTSGSDRLEWEKEEKGVINDLESFMLAYRNRVEQEAARMKVPLRRMIDACYKITYDQRYYCENELLVYRLTRIKCLLFPWAVRPQNNIFFTSVIQKKSLPNNVLSRVKNLPDFNYNLNYKLYHWLNKENPKR